MIALAKLKEWQHLPIGASLCLCLEGEASWLEAQVECVLLVLVGDVLEIMVTSDEDPQEVLLGLEFDWD